MASFAQIVLAHRRVVLCGGPRAGKSTLALTSVNVALPFSTDAYLEDVAWDDVPARAIADLACWEGRWVLEGCRTPWCLRAGLEADAAVWLGGVRGVLSSGQQGLAAACASVFEEWANSASVPVYRL